MSTGAHESGESYFLDTVSNILRQFGDRAYSGFGLSVLEHMLQTAQQAENDGGKPHQVLGGLLHDIGHFIVEFPAELKNTEDTRHDEAGAQLLKPHFGPEITEPIRYHVLAKRYLCTVEPEYYDTLSGPVRHTLRLQGGTMSPEEVSAFEDVPYAEEAVQIRRWCDRAMTPGKKTRTFESYHPLIIAHLKRQDA